MADTQPATLQGTRLLVVEDQQAVRELLVNRLRGHGMVVEAVGSVDEARSHFDRNDRRPRMVMLDLDLGGGVEDGLGLLEHFQRVDASVPVVVLTGNASVPNAVRVLRAGASDFLEKNTCLGENVDLCLQRLRMLLETLAENLRLKDHLSLVHARMRDRYRLLGVSFAVDEIRKAVSELAPDDRPVLVTGEPGSGKEMVAGTLHLQSRRARGPLVICRPASIDPDRLETVLLGNPGTSVGQLEQADGGTLYVDELNLLPGLLQRKLDEVVAAGRLPRGERGGSRPIGVRLVRGSVLSPSRLAELDKTDRTMMEQLAGRTIRVLPLRERPEDVELLVNHYAKLFGRRAQPDRPVRFTPEAMKKLRRHTWPGNIDELRSVVQQAVMASRDEIIGPFDVHFTPQTDASDRSFSDKLQAYEKRLLLDALTQCGFRQNRAAQLLGMTYDQFRHYYRKYDLGRTRHR